MNYDELAPGEVWEDRYDPRDGDDASPALPVAAEPFTDEERATLVPWF